MRTFEQMVREEDDEALDLARAALAIARTEFPGLDPEAYLARLDAMAGEVRRRAGDAASHRGLVVALNRYLFEDQGFRGNLEDYYDAQNSYLNRVLDRKLGIPISLSILYLELGRRLGLPMVGVGLPGHFLVKVAGAEEEILIDPFYKGAILDRAECQRRLDAIYGGKVVLTEQFLRAVGKREVLARMLYNLKRIHTKANDRARTVEVLNMLLALQPFGLEDLRDRGMTLFAMGRHAEALPDLKAYLDYLPGAADAADVRKAIAACERGVAPA